MSRQSKRPLTNAEQVAPMFVRCDCGADDTPRHRLVYLWFGDHGIVAATHVFTECALQQTRACVAAGPRDSRPSVLVRVKPNAELIALADRIGAPVQ